MKKIVAMVLAIVMLGSLAGCGSVLEITVKPDGTGTVDQFGFYVTKQDMEDMTELPETELSESWEEELEKVTYRDQEYYVIPYPDESLKESGVSMHVNDKRAYLLVGGQRSEDENSEIEIDFLDFIIHYPRPVVKANGEILEDEVSVRYNFMDFTDDSLWATFTDDAFDVNTAVIKGVKNGGMYKKAVIMEVATEGVITTSKMTVRTDYGTETESVGDTYEAFFDGDYTYTYVVGKKEKSIKFTIDTVKPKTNIENGKTYKAGKKITFSDNWSGIKTAKLDGKTIKSGKKVTAKGSHTLKLVDKCGNTTTVKFKIK